MPTVRELKISYVEREVADPRVGQPIRDVDSILRLMSFLRFSVDEEVWAIVLDAESRLIGTYQVSKGGRHETMIDPASLFRTVLMAEATGAILVHNHPSGGVRPSPKDIQTTEKLVLAGFALNTPLLDHVIIGAQDAYSFSRSGMLAWLQAKQLKALGVKGVPDVRHPEEAKAEARAAMANLARKEDSCPATEAAAGRMPVQREQGAEDDG
jgi:DNA repair protein RadC